MTQFPNLSDQDIADLLEYTTNPPKAEPAAAETDVNSTRSHQKAAQDEKNNSSGFICFLAAVGYYFWFFSD